MNEETLVPKLRFAGFTDNWEEITIKDYSTIKGRIGWRNLKQSEYTESGPYLIAGKHIHNGIINWDECDHLSVERYEESPEIALKKGDVIFSKDGSLGNPALIKELPSEATINGTMMLVRLNNKVSPNFFYQILNSDYFFRLLHILKSGSSIPHIFQRDMENFKFKIPNSYEEQNKISKFLENIDKKIELLEKKHNTYVNFKKYLMQQIFAQKLRFNCNDEWKKNKLNEISALTSSKRIYSSDYVKDGVPFYRGAEITQLNNNEEIKEKLFISTEKYNELKNKFGAPKKDDILVTGVGTLGNVYKIKDNTEFYFKDGNLIWIKDIKINPDYLELYLKRYKNEILKLSIGSTQKALTIESLEKLNVEYPSLEEQKNIVNFISSVDGKIYSIEKTLKNVKKFKKGLLQQMFV